MATRIDRRWIDVDTSGGLVDGKFGTGCLELPTEPDTLFGSFKTLEEEIDPIPRDEWKDRAVRMVYMEALVRKIKNQGRESSCVGNGSAKAFEIIRNLTYGVTREVEMSAMSIYKQIGGSARSGANIGDALVVMRDVGILPVDNAANRATYDHVFPATGFNTPWPEGWEETAKKFRITEWFRVRSFDGLATCLLLGVPVVYGRASHCICGVRLVYEPSRWLCKYANSWGGDWGENGFGYDSEKYLSRYGIGKYGVFAPRVPLLEPTTN